MSDPTTPTGTPAGPARPASSADAAPRASLGRGIAAARDKWGWFVALGIGLLAVGMVALAMPLVATVASVWTFGVLMIIGGIVQIFHAFQVRGWGGFFFWLLSGVVYMAAGVFALTNPVLAGGALTLAFGFIVIAVGALRIAAGLRCRPARGWGWIVAAGVINALFGIAIIGLWPASSLFLFGILLGVDLVFQGVSSIAFGLALRAHQIP